MNTGELSEDPFKTLYCILRNIAEKLVHRHLRDQAVREVHHPETEVPVPGVGGDLFHELQGGAEGVHFPAEI